MIQGQSVLAIIPARSGSKRIPNKNILSIGGSPLISWSIKAALSSNYIDKCIVTTDDERIADIARNYGAEIPFIRPAEFATDESLSVDVYMHAIKSMTEAYDVAIFLQPTSPLRTPSDIDKSLENMINKEAPSIVSVCENTRPLDWFVELQENLRIKNTLNQRLSNGKEKSKNYYFNGAVKAIKISHYLENKAFFSDETIVYIMPPERSVDIDNPIDFSIAESLLRNSQS